MSTLKEQLAKLTFTGRFPPQESSPAPREQQPREQQPREQQPREQQPREQQPRDGRPPRGARPAHAPAHAPARTIDELFERARLPLPPAGPKRFYFVVGDIVEFIDMDAQSYEVFSAGELGVVIDPQGRPCVLNRYALDELRALTRR